MHLHLVPPAPNCTITLNPVTLYFNMTLYCTIIIIMILPTLY